MFASDADQHIETICYDDDLYAARSWSHKRRVIIKGQITYHSGRQPRRISVFDHEYQKIASKKIYCGRGDAEIGPRNLKMGLRLTAPCSSFLANQLRVLMTAAAYVRPIHQLRLEGRVRAHIFLCDARVLRAVAYGGAWRESVCLSMRIRRPGDRDPVAPAQRSAGALRKAQVRVLEDGSPGIAFGRYCSKLLSPCTVPRL